MDKVHASSPDLDGWIVDLANVPDRLMPKVEKVVSKGALNIKKRWAELWSGHPHIKNLPDAINYDLTTTKDTSEAEIGPAHERVQGTLGHFIEYGDVEYGSVHNAPIPGGLPALRGEEWKFVKALGDLGEQVTRGVD